MPIAKRPWNGPGNVPYYVIKSVPKTADGAAVLDPVIHRIRPTGYPTIDEALDRAFKIIDQGRIVAEIKGLNINLSMAEVKKAYVQRPKP